MVKQFTTRGMPKNRYYDIDCSNPLSDSYLVGLSQASNDSLKQFLGFDESSEEHLKE